MIPQGDPKYPKSRESMFEGLKMLLMKSYEEESSVLMVSMRDVGGGIMDARMGQMSMNSKRDLILMLAFALVHANNRTKDSLDKDIEQLVSDVKMLAK